MDIIKFYDMLHKYNSDIDEFDQIYHMSDLYDYLLNFGYTEEEINDLNNIDIIDENEYNFNINDEYFWKNQYNGYLYSGSAEEVYNILLLPYSQKDNFHNDKNKLENNKQNIYRYELVINGKHYGLFNGIQYLWEQKKIDNNIMKKLNTYFSEMPVFVTKNDQKCYFTEKGYKHYQFAFSNIFKDIQKYCEIKLYTTNTSAINKKIDYIDEYQIVF